MIVNLRTLKTYVGNKRSPLDAIETFLECLEVGVFPWVWGSQQLYSEHVGLQFLVDLFGSHGQQCMHLKLVSSLI